MKRGGTRNRRSCTNTRDRRAQDLDIVTDPRETPSKVAIFDADNSKCWIRTDEALLIDLAAVR